MKLLLILIIAFLIIIYAYTYIKYKKRKKIDTVGAFRETYLKKKNIKSSAQDHDNMIPYLTKYNSSIDYIDKDDFIKENTASYEKESKPQPKKFQF